MNPAPPPAPTFKEAFRFWFRLGFISFGGPAGQIAILHDFLVEQKRWISPSKFLHALNYCMLLPGPEAQQLAIYTGWMLHGLRGGLAAGILFVLPSTIILWALSIGYACYGKNEAVQAAFEFLKPAVVAIVAGAIFKIGKKSLQTPLHWGLAVLAFVALRFFNVPFPIIILGALLLGILTTFLEQKRSPRGAQGNFFTENDEPGYLIHRHSVVQGSRWSPARLSWLIGVVAVLWFLPLGLLGLFAPNFAFWRDLSLFFSQAALVTFGGAYAVLPYVAQVSVTQFGWLSQAQMLDGLALGETTPGPLIIVLAFVGFMAGFNTFNGSIAAGTAGLFTTVWHTFLPSFLFVFAGAPLIERTQASPKLKPMLQFVTAAITGVMLNLCLFLGQSVLMPQFPDLQVLALAWFMVSLLALQYFKVNLLVWIGISVALGLGRYYFNVSFT